MKHFILIILLTCIGLAARSSSATINASFTSASSVPVTAASYTATGNTVNLSLGFAPPTGTTLTLVNNTGLSFITGRFSNLSQGQVVNLSYGGKSYRFVANYYGGTGNDLVLQWAYQYLAAWGSNARGQLGNNSTTYSSVPVLVTQSGVLAGKTVVSVAAGDSHGLALCSDGTMAAWGWNTYGQLGNNSTTDSSVPVLVTQSGVLAGKTVVSVAAGDEHSLALCSDGTVAAWGLNKYGELGNNSTTNSSVPVLVTQSGVLAGKTVVSVAAGSSHSLARCSDGTLAAWGDNTYGQLGNDIIGGGSSVPALVQSGELAGKTVVSVSAGWCHNLALCSDGTVAAWGWNINGQLGLGYNSPYPGSVPVPMLVTQSGVLAGKTVVSVAAGGINSLALCSDGTVAAWGSNSKGQLGNNSTTDSSVPVLVTQSGVLAGKTVVSVELRGYDSLALCSDGTVATWGLNGSGALGNGSTTDSSVPVLVTQSGVLAGKTVVSVASGEGYSLALASVQNSADLSGLSLSSGTLSPAFAAATTSYTASVPNATTSITVTPTLADTTATVTVNGTIVASGTASGAISLAVGTNVISTVVTAQDGTTQSTYTTTVTRATSYTSWIANYPSLTGANALSTANPSHDGLTNLMKYALGLDPTVAHGAPGSLNGSTLSFTKGTMASGDSNVSYTIQESTDMVTWATATRGIVSNNSGSITYTFPSSRPSNLFVRLQVTQSP